MLGNVTKSQGMWSPLMMAIEVLRNGYFQPNLALLLLDFGQNNHQPAKQKSLESTCLEYLAQHSDEYAQGYTEKKLPNFMLQRINIIKLTQLNIGAWAGDQLIITGDYSEYILFSPDAYGRGESRSLYDVISNRFAMSPAVKAIFSEENRGLLDKLTKLCEDKLHFIVNLDLKEYLDPRAYGTREKNAPHSQFVFKWQSGVMAGLLIKLVHSTGSGGGHLPSSITSQGTWTWCRVSICAAEDVEDFENFKDVSNPEDVRKLKYE